MLRTSPSDSNLNAFKPEPRQSITRRRYSTGADYEPENLSRPRPYLHRSVSNLSQGSSTSISFCEAARSDTNKKSAISCSANETKMATENAGVTHDIDHRNDTWSRWVVTGSTRFLDVVRSFGSFGLAASPEEKVAKRPEEIVANYISDFKLTSSTTIETLKKDFNCVVESALTLPSELKDKALMAFGKKVTEELYGMQSRVSVEAMPYDDASWKDFREEEIIPGDEDFWEDLFELVINAASDERRIEVAETFPIETAKTFSYDGKPNGPPDDYEWGISPFIFDKVSFCFVGRRRRVKEYGEYLAQEHESGKLYNKFWKYLEDFCRPQYLKV